MPRLFKRVTPRRYEILSDAGIPPSVQKCSLNARKLPPPDYGRIQRSSTTWRGPVTPGTEYSVIDGGSRVPAIMYELSTISRQEHEILVIADGLIAESCPQQC